MTRERSFAAAPYFSAASSMIAIWPFRYFWNNPPRFVGDRAWLAILIALSVFFIVVGALTCLAMICWNRWRSGASSPG